LSSPVDTGKAVGILEAFADTADIAESDIAVLDKQAVGKRAVGIAEQAEFGRLMRRRISDMPKQSHPFIVHSFCKT